jgi:energy-coupling factor transporter ATP-binding protein EcfA2
MGTATRVLVTHQRQYLPQCDRVLVMRRGGVFALGSWQEIAAMQLPELVAGGGAGLLLLLLLLLLPRAAVGLHAGMHLSCACAARTG